MSFKPIVNKKTERAPTTVQVVKISQPSLDDNHKWLLEGKKDRVEGLDFINVRFYPRGHQEITYGMDGHMVPLTVSEFQRVLREKEVKGKTQHEETAAAGFATKLMKRCFVEIEDVTVESIRAIQAGVIPKAAGSLLGLTQELFKQKGLSDLAQLLTHWMGMSNTVKVQMNEWQANVNPKSIKWSVRVMTLARELREAETRKAAKKLLKGSSLANGVDDVTLQEVMDGKSDPAKAQAKAKDGKTLLGNWGDEEEEEEEPHPRTQKELDTDEETL